MVKAGFVEDASADFTALRALIPTEKRDAAFVMVAFVVVSSLGCFWVSLLGLALLMA